MGVLVVSLGESLAITCRISVSFIASRTDFPRLHDAPIPDFTFQTLLSTFDPDLHHEQLHSRKRTAIAQCIQTCMRSQCDNDHGIYTAKDRGNSSGTSRWSAPQQLEHAAVRSPGPLKLTTCSHSNTSQSSKRMAYLFYPTTKVQGRSADHSMGCRRFAPRTSLSHGPASTRHSGYSLLLWGVRLY